MSVILTLQVDDKHAKEMHQALIQDLYDKGRADIKVTQNKNELTFKISSEDFTSIRATINSVLLKLRMFSEIDKKLAKNEKDI